MSSVCPACPCGPCRPVRTQAPAPQLTFRVETNYIEVDAVVTDAQGRFVRDLKREDFEVLEDRRPQKVDLFALVDIPLERLDRPIYRPTPIAPDVATNSKEFEGRVYVLLLDAHHVPATDTLLVKKAALRFIDQYIGANDLAAVVLAQTGSRDDNQEFTSSKPALRAAVDKFVGEKVRSRALAVRDSAIQKQGLERVGVDMLDAKDPEAIERVAKARATLDSIARLSNYIAGIRGRRKAVVLFSEGLDYNLDDTIGPRSRAPGESGTARNPLLDNSPLEAIHAAGILESMQTMFEAASRANVAIYSVDPRGVASEMDTLIQTTGMPEGSQISIDSVTMAARDELRRQLGTLRTFAEATGGLALVGTNDFDGGFRRLVEDNSAYYVLGYNADVKRDGKFHDITVRVKRPGVQVRARRGYYASKDTKPVAAPPDPTILLLNSPMPVGGLGLRLTTTTLKGTGANVKVLLTVEVDGSQITLAGRNGAFATKVDLTYAAVDMSANVKASGRKSMDSGDSTGGAQGRRRARPAARHGIRAAAGPVSTPARRPRGGHGPVGIDLLGSADSRLRQVAAHDGRPRHFFNTRRPDADEPRRTKPQGPPARPAHRQPHVLARRDARRLRRGVRQRRSPAYPRRQRHSPDGRRDAGVRDEGRSEQPRRRDERRPLPVSGARATAGSRAGPVRAHGRGEIEAGRRARGAGDAIHDQVRSRVI